jgi:DNA-binding XRE family transcriptional regulator
MQKVLFWIEAACCNRAVPNYKSSHPLVITLRGSLYPDRTLGDRIRKWRLEKGLFQVELAKKIKIDEMTVVNLEKGRTNPTPLPAKKNLEELGKLNVI